MISTVCSSTAIREIGADEVVELTELVRGQDRALVERLEPLVLQQSIELNLNTVERIDAAGIAALVTLYATACQAGHSFSLSHVSPRVTKILALVGLDRILLPPNAVGTSHCSHPAQRSAA
jgi:anti-anti-sigma factor